MIKMILDYFRYGRFIIKIEESGTDVIVTTKKSFDKDELRLYIERKSKLNFIAKEIFKMGTKESTWVYYSYRFSLLDEISWIDGG